MKWTERVGDGGGREGKLLARGLGNVSGLLVGGRGGKRRLLRVIGSSLGGGR